MFSVGHQLQRAREARLLSIEDVAFETRIPHQRLRDMENDDLSNFANLTYAKGFLKLYSRFLQLDLSDYLDEFDTSAVSDAAGHDYIQTSTTIRSFTMPATAMEAARYRPVQGNHYSLIAMAAAAVLALIGAWVLFAHKNHEPSATAEAPAGRAPAQALTGASAAPAGIPGESIPTILAKAEPVSRATIVRGTPEPPSPTPAEAVIRRAMPVDDEGNEIVRPPR